MNVRKSWIVWNILIKFCIHINSDNIEPKELLNAIFLWPGAEVKILFCCHLVKMTIILESLGIFWLFSTCKLILTRSRQCACQSYNDQDKPRSEYENGRKSWILWDTYIKLIVKHNYFLFIYFFYLFFLILYFDLTMYIYIVGPYQTLCQVTAPTPTATYE